MVTGMGVPQGENDIQSSTIVVAASDSLMRYGVANFFCTGVDDEAVIQAAYDALPIDGGRIILLEGTYWLTPATDAVLLQFNSRPVVLEGQGAGKTIIKLAASAERWNFIIRATHTCIIRDLTIDGLPCA